mgnify:CR=1 FL=1
MVEFYFLFRNDFLGFRENFPEKFGIVYFSKILKAHNRIQTLGIQIVSPCIGNDITNKIEIIDRKLTEVSHFENFPQTNRKSTKKPKISAIRIIMNRKCLHLIFQYNYEEQIIKFQLNHLVNEKDCFQHIRSPKNQSLSNYIINPNKQLNRFKVTFLEFR